MKLSKVQSIVKTNKTWQSNKGSMMYDYNVDLEDGVKGTASSTNPDNPPYSVGDEVEYSTKPNQYSYNETRLSIKKAGLGFNPGGGGFKRSPEDQKKMENSWAIQTAVQVLGKCPKEVTVEQWLVDCAEVARMLLVKRDTLN
tara:strand:- start:134 stop:559 length:426 start_codon:yes stop_codon:yes gene_type:complete